MTDQQQAFERVLSLLDEAGCQDHLVLIGSWAEFVWREAGLLEGFDPNIHTLDVDFLVKNMRRPDPPASLAVLARRRGSSLNPTALMARRRSSTYRALRWSSSLAREALVSKQPWRRMWG